MKNVIRVLVVSVIAILSLTSRHSSASGADISRELFIRLETERLSSQQKLDLIQEALQSMGLKDRIIFYSVSLNELVKQNYPLTVTDQLFLKALDDLKQVPRGMFKEGGNCYWGDNEALGCFAQWSMMWAMSNIGMSPSVAQQYVTSFFTMPWLDASTVSSVALDVGRDKDLKYPYLRQMVTSLLSYNFPTPDYSAGVAFNILGPVRYKVYCPFNPCTGFFVGYGFSNKESLWIVDSVLKSGKAGARDNQGLPELRHEFVLGTEFENRVNVLPNPQDNEMAASILKKMILRRPSDSPYLSEVMLTWLIDHPIQESTTADLVETLLQELKSIPTKAFTIKFSSDSRGALDALRDMPVLLSLPKDIQDKIYTLIFSKFSGDDEESRNARSYAMVVAFHSGTKLPLPGVQKAMELLADGATPGDSTSKIIGDETKRESSAMGDLIGYIQGCEKPGVKSAQACGGITDSKMILEKVAKNPVIAQVIRDRAQSYIH